MVDRYCTDCTDTVQCQHIYAPQVLLASTGQHCFPPDTSTPDMAVSVPDTRADNNMTLVTLTLVIGVFN